MSASSGGVLGTGAGGGWGGVALVGSLAVMRAGAVAAVNNAETAAQIDSANASFERRKQEWELQHQLALTETAIGEQQVTLANSHKAIADKEKKISETQPADSQNKQTDRQGLTGSVRLLQDITRLDEFAFETNQRKLQLAETYSLSRLFPVEFQGFRETGRLPFATPMTLFDQGFPGHYLRLIKRISLSIVALVPPTRGVRATLIASGISRVVTGGDTFQSIIVRRDPELIASTSTSNATGLLELEPDAGMLRPFESMGVDTHWELQLPKAANPFDFRTIAECAFHGGIHRPARLHLSAAGHPATGRHGERGANLQCPRPVCRPVVRLAQPGACD